MFYNNILQIYTQPHVGLKNLIMYDFVNTFYNILYIPFNKKK